MNIFSNDRQKSLKELLDVISKGIDLLATDTLNKDLYDAFEKYADSTIKMVDESYGRNYISYFSNLYVSHNYFNHIDPIDCTHISVPHSAIGVVNNYVVQRQLTEYREKLKNLLQKLISVAKTVVHE